MPDEQPIDAELERTPNLLAVALIAVGAIVLVVGVGLVSIAAAVTVAGVLLLAAGLDLGRSSS